MHGERLGAIRRRCRFRVVGEAAGADLQSVARVHRGERLAGVLLPGGAELLSEPLALGSSAW